MPEYSALALATLALLRERHNVLVSGAPGTGKSRLLNEVAKAFVGEAAFGPVLVLGQEVSIPIDPPEPADPATYLPSPDQEKRRVFRTVFHQNSKHREFVTGLSPVIDSKVEGGTAFKVVLGTLFRASEFAKQDDAAALLIIDEINRGPAVQVFGGSIVAIETDKRLAPDGLPSAETQFFELLAPDTGDIVEYALPHHLYILAAMNQADTSVEPLDVAFLRRWSPIRLVPDVSVLRSHFELDGVMKDLPSDPDDAKQVYEAAVHALVALNERIKLGRGPEYEIGQGVFMSGKTPKDSVDGALIDVAESWQLVMAHIEEVFFGDTRGIAAVLNVSNVDGHTYEIVDATFADEPRLELRGPDAITASNVYKLLRDVGTS